jgi:hypothetical protein
LNRVLVTYDHDFWAEAAHRQADGLDFPGVVLVTVRQTVIGPVASDLVLAATALDPEHMVGRIDATPFR